MNTHKVHEYAIATIVVLGVILVYLCFLLWQQSSQVRTFQTGRDMHQRALTANDVNHIAPWMTFDFINRVFRVPGSYLQNVLQITGTKYPNISLEQYARAHALDTNAFVARVQTEVGAYLTSASQNP